MIRLLKVVALLTVLGLACGCVPLIFAGAGAGAGVGTYAYVKGDLEVEYASDYESVWNATLQALDDRNIGVEGQSRDGFKGVIKARRASGTVVTVKVVGKATRVTVVRIRVGTFGDEQASLMIKKSIDRHLGLG